MTSSRREPGTEGAAAPTGGRHLRSEGDQGLVAADQNQGLPVRGYGHGPARRRAADSAGACGRRVAGRSCSTGASWCTSGDHNPEMGALDDGYPSQARLGGTRRPAGALWGSLLPRSGRGGAALMAAKVDWWMV